MQELESITQGRAAELIRETGKSILEMDGGYAELEDLLALIGQADRITKYSGVGYGIRFRVNDIWHRVELL